MHILLTVLILLLRQTPAPGAIEVHAIDAETGWPLKNARIDLIRPAQRSDNASAFTDDQGIYTFSHLEPGSYVINVGGPGYLPQSHRTSNASITDPPDDIAVTEGVYRVTYSLTRAATISGRIYNVQRQPLEQVEVQLIPAGYDQAGRPRPPRRTNEQGEYEFDAIPPGTYYLRASSNGTTTYFPGVMHAGDANPIAVRAGSDLRTMDFSLLEPAPFHVSGHILNPDSKGVHPGYDYRLVFSSSRIRSDEGAVVNREASNEQFRLDGLSPGSYDLYIGYPGNDIGSNWSFTGHASFDIVDRNVDGLTVPIQEGLDVEGFVSFDDPIAQEKPENLPLPLLNLADTLPSVLSPNATNPVVDLSEVSRKAFSIPHVFRGRYRLSFNYLPDEYDVSAARLGGRDILNQAFEITDDSHGPLEIELSRSGGSLQGVVKGRDGNPAGGATVYLMPAIERDERLLYKTVRADAQGQFTIRGIAPGRYTALVFVFSGAPFDINEVMNPEFITPYLGGSASIELKNGQTTRQDLTALEK
jgi:protocatechuate 3,4-dioxygenase beta subunit